jgi:hypothetical protein
MADDELLGVTVPAASRIVPSGAPGIPGSTGLRGFPSWTETTDDFEVPAVGEQVTVSLAVSTEWLVAGAFVALGEMMAVVVAVSGNDATLVRVTWPRGEQGPMGPQGIQGEKGDQGVPGFPDDCPQDGRVYGRKDGQWVRLGMPVDGC